MSPLRVFTSAATSTVTLRFVARRPTSVTFWVCATAALLRFVADSAAIRSLSRPLLTRSPWRSRLVWPRSTSAQPASAREDRDERERRGADAEEPAARLAARALGLVAAAPGEHRVGEDVVEELVARAPALVDRGRDRAEDAPALGGAELVEHAP